MIHEAEEVIVSVDPAYPEPGTAEWYEAERVRRQHAPGKGGSACKRIRRTAALYRVAWGFKRKRWPAGWNPKARKHGWRNAGMRYRSQTTHAFRGYR